jgi:hypothetical protein
MRRKAARRVRDKRGKAEKCGEAPGTRRLLERVKTVENLQNVQNHRVGRYTAYQHHENKSVTRTMGHKGQ